MHDCYFQAEGNVKAITIISILLVIVLLIFLSVANAYELRELPNGASTPGDALKVSKAVMCVSGYTKGVRNVPDSLKKQVFESYGITKHFNRYEVDHLINLGIGGSNDIKNLWPQPYFGLWNARKKDRLEDYLRHKVCKGEINPVEARKKISKDWIAYYKELNLDDGGDGLVSFLILYRYFLPSWSRQKRGD